MTTTKPLVLICATPVYGHLMPLKAIAKQLVARGYEVTFLTAIGHKEKLQGFDGDVALLEGYCNFVEYQPWEARRKDLMPGLSQLSFDLEHIFVNSMPSQYESQQKALKKLEEKHPGKPIVIVTESGFFGSVPGMAGAPGIKPAGYLSLGVIPLMLSSIDCAPFGPGLPPDASPEGQMRNVAMNEVTRDYLFASPQKRFLELLRETGATAFDPSRIFLDQIYLLPDQFLQLCTPSAEYPRSDAPQYIQCAGCLPKGVRDPFTDLPSWWPEVTCKTKKVIAVSQGTLALTYTDLIVPSIQGLASRDDILFIVALGKKGATLCSDTAIPPNTRVVDWIPFDDLLPHCDAFITNGGYGAFQHCISTGTPLIVCGATEDKPEVAMRAEWCGIGINLRSGTPTPAAIEEAVDMILDSKYKIRAAELQKEMDSLNPMDLIAQSIDKLANSW